MSTRCSYIKEDGEQCKLDALEGERYCHIHLRMVGEAPTPPPEEVTEEETSEDMPAIHTKGDRQLRYIGKGTFMIPSLGLRLTAEDHGREITVPYHYWERAHTNTEVRKVFEEV